MQLFKQIGLKIPKHPDAILLWCLRSGDIKERTQIIAMYNNKRLTTQTV